MAPPRKGSFQSRMSFERKQPDSFKALATWKGGFQSGMSFERKRPDSFKAPEGRVKD
jgi:hypothetical protein